MRRRFGLLLLATAVWLPALQLLFRAPDRAALAADLAARQRHLALAPPGPERALLRRVNPEWDLMARTFTVLAFANLALAEPQRRAEHLAVVNALVDGVLRDERAGQHTFLLPHAQAAPFRDAAGRSLFVDGEVALMVAARQVVAPRADLGPVLRARVDALVAQFERAPGLFPESYPDEGWTFCNTVALAAVRLSDRVDGRDHSALLARWAASARARLLERRTGLLVSSFTWGAAPLDGPEGSTLWLAAHMLQVVDPELAKDQYRRARRELVHQALGFAWASEWPLLARNVDDVDSGPTIPLVDANAGSSGLALLGAAAFDDEALLDGLVTSLHFAAFPVRDGPGLRFAAGNQLADAVLLYALVEGPLWRAVDAPALEARR